MSAEQEHTTGRRPPRLRSRPNAQGLAAGTANAEIKGLAPLRLQLAGHARCGCDAFVPCLLYVTATLSRKQCDKWTV